MTANKLWNSLSVPCICEGFSDDMCPCAQVDGAEKCLRYVMAVDGVLNAEQREYCLKEIDSVEGHKRADYEGLGDRDLASATLHAWQDYARDKGLR